MVKKYRKLLLNKKYLHDKRLMKQIAFYVLVVAAMLVFRVSMYDNSKADAKTTDLNLGPVSTDSISRANNYNFSHVLSGRDIKVPTVKK